MKKIKFFGLMAMAALAFAACGDDDDTAMDPVPAPTDSIPGPHNPGMPDREYNAFMLGTGVEGYGTGGEVAMFNKRLQSITGGLFARANGRELGMTSNDMAICWTDSQSSVAWGEACITVTTSNVIEFVKLPSMESIMHIELAGKQYAGPRCVIYSGKHAYVTMKSGHLVSVDTKGHTIDCVVGFTALEGSPVGTYPEGLAEKDGKIYVALSGQGDGIENRVAVVDAASMKLERYIAVAPNLTDVVALDGHLYALSAGWYDPSNNYAQTDAGLFEFNDNGSLGRVCAATIVAPCGNMMYYINAPYGVSATSLGTFSPEAGNKTLLSPAPGVSPTAMGAAPDGSYLLIGSYQMGEWGYASYDAPGYVISYDTATQQANEYDTDVYGINRFVFY